MKATRGSFAPLVWAANIKGLDASSKAVLVALATYADADGFCYPSIRSIGENAGYQDRAVRGAIGALEARGLLLTTDRQGGQGKATRYHLRVGATVGGAAPEKRSPKTRTQGPGMVIGNPDSEAAFVAPDTRQQMPGNPDQYPAPDAAYYPAPDAGYGPDTRHQMPGKELNTRHLTTLYPAPDAAELSKELEEGSLEREGQDSFIPPRRALAGPLSEGWKMSRGDAAYAAGLGLDPDRVFAGWRNHRLAHGTIRPNWSADFRWWCDREARDHAPRRVETAATAAGRELHRRIDAAFGAEVDGAAPRPRLVGNWGPLA